MVNSGDFSKRLQKILDYYGLSATAFSDEIDFNRSTISHLLSGRNKPSLEFVMKVVQTFEEVNIYWLLNGKGSFPSDQDTVPPIKKSLEKPKTENPDLFQQEEIEEKIKNDSILFSEKINTSEKHIERIVIFFKDGSFKSYEN